VIDIVDDFSRYSWVYFLETKDEVFGLVRDLILRLKNERQYDPIRAIRSDNGTEFKNARFEASIVIMVLNISFPLPMYPLKNRTLVEMPRTMLDEHRTPMKYWAEAVNTACYISNQILLRALLKKTSYELMHRRVWINLNLILRMESFFVMCLIVVLIVF